MKIECALAGCRWNVNCKCYNKKEIKPISLSELKSKWELPDNFKTPMCYE